MRRVVRVSLVGAVMAGLSIAGAGGASAAHCTGPAGAEPSPGFSYYGTTHVAEQDAHNGTPEGGNPGPHAGTSGASNCRETTGSPSERAPGRD